ncbi:unnamed protein product [Nippostrongylus brasiliensis]|uniref:Spliceosome-associated protein CWC27 homolog n=1 Tax=Nippostrongylus brasiliensis TaxID=27835 RepID=A0A0N4YQI3_NIPBR|nr:unnamed protein product [Nippostrongylus brasiliensis]
MEKYYNGTIFHRLIISSKVEIRPVRDVAEKAYTESHLRGLVGMANAGRDDNGSQFFFTVGNDVRDLDKKHTLFGKIVGNTVFNMLKMTECDVDDNERPRTIHKITGVDVLTNPFDDIKPRERVKEKKEKKKEKKPIETKKLNLLSFGDEAEEDEMEVEQVNKVLNKKGKSAHDVLSEDPKLSKQVAVTADEMADYDPVRYFSFKDADRDASTVSSVRAKFAVKRKIEEVDDDGKDEDFERMIDEERRKQERERMEAMQAELKAMQKEHIKALRKPKEKDDVEQAEEQTEAMKMYYGLKLKFKSKAKDIVKTKDPTRENQTMSLLERFQKRLAASNQTAILHDKKIEIKEPEKEKEDEEEKFGVDLDAEDTVGDDWMMHKFEARDEDPNVSKAKDANLREESEDWYSIHDPRNKMNQRRRGEI